MIIKFYNLTVVSNIIDSVADRGGKEGGERMKCEMYCMCEAILIKRAHAHTLSTGSTYVSKKRLNIFGSMKP